MKIEVCGVSRKADISVYHCKLSELLRAKEINKSKKPTWWKAKKFNEEFGVDEDSARMTISLAGRVSEKKAIYCLNRRKLHRKAEEVAKKMKYYTSPYMIVEFYDYKKRFPEDDDEVENFWDEMEAIAEMRKGKYE